MSIKILATIYTKDNTLQKLLCYPKDIVKFQVEITFDDVISKTYYCKEDCVDRLSITKNIIINVTDIDKCTFPILVKEKEETFIDKIICEQYQDELDDYCYRNVLQFM